MKESGNRIFLFFNKYVKISRLEKLSYFANQNARYGYEKRAKANNRRQE